MSFELRSEPWMKHAKCKGMETALWFPVRGESQKAAKAVCALCSVRPECWDYACRSDCSYGIWGGQIIKRGRDKNTVSYPWSTIYLDEDLYWDGWIDETGESFSEFGQAVRVLPGSLEDSVREE